MSLLEVKILQLARRYDRVWEGGSGSEGRDECVSEVELSWVDCCGVVGRTWCKRRSCTKSEEDRKDNKWAWIAGFNMASLRFQGSVGDCYFLVVLSAVVKLRDLSAGSIQSWVGAIGGTG